MNTANLTRSGVPNVTGAQNFIDPTATLRPGVKVWHYARILSNVTLLDNVSVGSCAEVGANSIIGANTRISAGVFLPAGSIIGDNVFIGPNVTFTDDRYPRAGNTHYHAEPPIVQNGASVGAGATILPGITIGSRSLIGAGSVVTKNVPPNTTFYGLAATERATPPEMAVLR